MKSLLTILSIALLIGCATPQKPLTQAQAQATWDDEERLYDFKVTTWAWQHASKGARTTETKGDGL